MARRDATGTGDDDANRPMRCRISVRAMPASARSGVVGPYGDAWKVRLAAAPEKGRANDELVRVLADALGIDRRSIRVVAGAASRDKVVEIDGIAADLVDRILRDGHA
jgi:uncharacterized protein (TIGR00251 family)